MLTDLVGDGVERMLVALVAGATRGAGRAIAVELARAGFFVYATGRSSRAAGPSEIGRPETIEDTERIVKGLAAELENGQGHGARPNCSAVAGICSDTGMAVNLAS